ncbi:hypothetical protein ACWDCC_41115 [Streptomyces sp. NPDC001102]
MTSSADGYRTALQQVGSVQVYQVPVKRCAGDWSPVRCIMGPCWRHSGVLVTSVT